MSRYRLVSNLPQQELYKIFAYDLYGHCNSVSELDFNKAINIALEKFKDGDICIVRMVSPHQDNDVLYMSKVGY